MQYRQVVLTFGYVEAQRVSSLVLQANDPELDTVEKTLVSVATDLFEWWWHDRGYTPASQKCRCCGQLVEQTADCFVEVFEDLSSWLLELPYKTTDDLLGLDDLDPTWNIWIPWSEVVAVPIEETVVVDEAAESLLRLFVDFENIATADWVTKGYSSWLDTRSESLADQRAKAIEQSVASE